MDNTDDKNFIRNNSDKPFIRTMEDDLKKIKNSPIGKDGVAAAISSLASSSTQKSARLGEMKRPTPFQPAKSESIPDSIPRVAHSPSVRLSAINSAPAPAAPSSPIPDSGAKQVSPPMPMNLPVDKVKAKKASFDIGSKMEAMEITEKPKASFNSSTFDDRKLNEIKPEKNETVISRQEENVAPLFKAAAPFARGISSAPKPAASVARPIAPVSSDRFFEKKRSAGILDDEIENLSPEARLARQSSFNINENTMEQKENLIAPSSAARTPEMARAPKDQYEQQKNSIISNASVQESRRKSIEEIIKEDNSDSFVKKIIKILFIVLIVAGISASVYYKYFSESQGDNPSATDNTSETFIEGATEVTINADLDTALASNIVLYFSTVKPSGMYKLILKDKNSQEHLKLDDFSKSLNIVLPNNIANALEKDYNLIVFNYPEKNYLRLGLALKVKNSVEISTAARDWENSIYGDIKPMFLNSPGIYTQGKQFGSNTRGNFDIRYLPLGFDNIGLNYAIDKEKKYLLIATSKDDIFILIDKIIQ